MSGSILGLRDEDQVELLQLSGDHNLRVSVLGQHVRTSAERSEALSRMIWCTYRANIAAFGPTGIRSDAGWGCMHRAAQMVLANALARHFGDLLQRRVLAWFDDSVDDARRAPFAAQHLARAGQRYGTTIGHWFGPQVACSAVRDLVTLFDELTGDFAVYVARDGVIYRDELDQATAASRQTGCLILVPQRLGLDHLNPAYIAQVRRALESPFSCGIAGGRSNGARFFCGVVHSDNDDDSVLLLDPHTVQLSFALNSNAEFDESSFRVKGAATMPLRNIDPSLAFAFYCRDASEREALLSSIDANVDAEFQAISVVNKLPDYLRDGNESQSQSNRSTTVMVSFDADEGDVPAADSSDVDAMYRVNQIDNDNEIDEFAML